MSCNRARSLWFAALALDDLLTWGLAPSARRCLCLHRHTLCERCRCYSSISRVVVVPSVCLSEEGARIPVNTPASRLPLHSIPVTPSQLQRRELPIAPSDAVTALYSGFSPQTARLSSLSIVACYLLVDTCCVHSPCVSFAFTAVNNTALQLPDPSVNTTHPYAHQCESGPTSPRAPTVPVVLFIE